MKCRDCIYAHEWGDSQYCSQWQMARAVIRPDAPACIHAEWETEPELDEEKRIRHQVMGEFAAWLTAFLQGYQRGVKELGEAIVGEMGIEKS